MANDDLPRQARVKAKENWRKRPPFSHRDGVEVDPYAAIPQRLIVARWKLLTYVALKLSNIAHQLILRQNGFFWSFPSVCPEPVLVKSSFLCINGQNRPFSYLVFRRDCLDVCPCRFRYRGSRYEKNTDENTHARTQHIHRKNDDLPRQARDRHIRKED